MKQWKQNYEYNFYYDYVRINNIYPVKAEIFSLTTPFPVMVSKSFKQRILLL